ncbi:MAG: hypothetical protein ABI665_25570, partial [Vicinamibacterales bacterium]
FNRTAATLEELDLMGLMNSARDDILALWGVSPSQASLPMAAGLLSLVRSLGARRARLVATGAMSLVLLVGAVAGTPGGSPAMTFFFMLVPVVFGGLFSLAWLLAGEIIGRDSPDLASAFSGAGAASILGGLLGAGLARGLAPWVAPRGLLLISAVVLAAAMLAMVLTHRRFSPVEAPVLTGPIVAAPAFTTAFGQRYVRLLLSIAALTAVCGVLIEFQFYRAAAAYSGADGDRTALFANFYIGLSLAALAIQWFVAPRLQAAIGLTSSLLILPGAIVGLLPAVLGLASGTMHAVLRLTEGGLKSSVHRSSWEQTYLLIGAGCRTEAKLLVDGVGTRVAEGLCALFLYLGLVGAPAGSGSNGLFYALLVASILWVSLTIRARRVLEPGGATPRDPAECYARMPDS